MDSNGTDASTSFRLSKLTETRESSLPPLDDWSPPPSPALSAAITLSTANLSGRLALSPAATEYKPSSNGSASGESKSSRSTVAQLVSLGNTSASSSYSRALSDTSDSSSASLARPFPRRSAPSSSQGGSVSSLPNHGFPPLPRQFLATPLAPAAPAFTPSSSFVPNSAPRPSHSTPSSFSEYLELIEKCKEEVKKYQALVVNSEKAAQTQLREKQVLQEQLKRAETEHQEQMKRKRLEMGQLWITIEALRKEKDSIQSGGVKDDNRRAELDQAIEERDAAITRASRLKSDLTHEHTSSLEERRHYQKALEVAQARRASAEDHNEQLQVRLDESILELIRLEDLQASSAPPISSAELDSLRQSLTLAQSSLDSERLLARQLRAQLAEMESRLRGKEMALEREKASVVATAKSEVDRMRKERDALRMCLKGEESAVKSEKAKERLLKEQAEEELTMSRAAIGKLRVQMKEQVLLANSKAEDEKFRRMELERALESAMRSARPGSVEDEKTLTHGRSLSNAQKENEYLQTELVEASDVIDALLAQIDILKASLKRGEQSGTSSRDASVIRTTTNSHDSSTRNGSVSLSTSIRPFAGQRASESLADKSWRMPQPGKCVKMKKPARPISLSNKYEGLKIEG